MGPSREGLLDVISQAVSRNFEWSWKLVDALVFKISPILASCFIN